MNHQRILFRAAMIADGSSIRAAPGALLVDGHRIIAAGSPQSVGEHPEFRLVELPDSVLIPPLVNVHAHLDLTHIGPVPYPGEFAVWVDLVRAQRAREDRQIAASVLRGAALAVAGGTALVGDIAGAGSATPVHALRASGLGGVSFVEVFGLGRGQAHAIARLQQIVDQCPAEDAGVRLGLQPHAPYSCGLEVYRAAARMGRPMATHLAETLEELTFVDSAQGPLADLVRRVGAWDDTIAGHGCHPVDYLGPVLERCPIVAAHLNYLEDRHIEMISRWPISVAYCPRASAYFGHPHGSHPPHRYREMLSAGVNVSLGTDGIICLATPDRISVLDEMRFLHRRDGTEPGVLIRMATINGAKALGVDPEFVTFAPGSGRKAGVLALPIEPGRLTDPLVQVLSRDEAPRWVVGPFRTVN